MKPEAFVHYKLGIPFLDDQHWEMLCLLSAVYKAESIDSALAQIDKIQVLMDAHNKIEIEFMTEMGFPFATMHIQNHV